MTAIISPTMLEKRDALVSLIKETLDAASTDGTTWIVVDRFRQIVESSSGTRRERDRIMGKPTRYCRLALLGTEQVEDQFETLDAESETAHVFGVFLWCEYKDHDTASKASQRYWDTVTEGLAGLLPVLRSTRALATATGVSAIEPPADVTYTDAPINMGDDHLCHYLAFFLTVR